MSAAGNLSDLPLDKPASLLYYLACRDDWVSRSVELTVLVDAPLFTFPRPPFQLAC